jgi:hypothetical protein
LGHESQPHTVVGCRIVEVIIKFDAESCVTRDMAEKGRSEIPVDERTVAVQAACSYTMAALISSSSTS